MNNLATLFIKTETIKILLETLQIKVKESPRVFNRGMNLVNNFAKIFGSLK